MMDIKEGEIEFQDYMNESQLDHVMKMVTADLSEPYSIFTYRYFLHRFPELCILAVDESDGKPIGCVVGKIDMEEGQAGRGKTMTTGYIGMLAVQSSYRRKGIGKSLVRKVLERMKSMGCQSVTLETGVC
jgi:peptide alpha-N-acetyltransferase